ncbi:MAG: glucokinase [Pseudomonadota bacterium]
MRLLADIGGTNARFAVSEGSGHFSDVTVLAVADHERFEHALEEYVRSSGATITDAALAAAGPVIDGQIRLTNAAWEISSTAVRSVLPHASVTVVNDLAAVARALPELGASDVRILQPGTASQHPEPMIAINVGTGFGAAVAIPHHADWLILPTEAGHMRSKAPGADAPPDHELIVESLLSGPGLRRFRAELGDTDDVRRRFSVELGAVAGDLVLATGSWGGVYLCGGVLTPGQDTLDDVAFTSGLHRASGVGSRLNDVPVRQITHPQPAMLGLSHL